MRVAVITPYYKEDLATLRRCHDSVLAQTYPCTHFMVADGHARRELDSWDLQHLTLATAHGDYGNTPRSIGATSALNQGFEAFAWLDADNWYRPEHVEAAVECCRTQGVQAAFSSRQIILPNGTLVRAEDREVVDRRHVDTNCQFFTAEAAFLIPLWAMLDRSLTALGDRVAFLAIRRRVTHAWTGKKTVFYESRWKAHFEWAGLPPPEDEHLTDSAGAARAFNQARHNARLGWDMPIRIPKKFLADPRDSSDGSGGAA